ncbi:MAG TPA: GNAT family N-acetyltransferase [Myxococcaceae bacterium]|nr:GNAT family N-acetyltransferase [Myxococcaceae bacterium]
MNDFEVHIRPARAADAPALVQLFSQLGYSSDEETIRAQLDHFCRGGAHALVAELANRRLAGIATVAIHPRLYTRAPSAQLTALVTDREARRHGVGRALTRGAAELARSAGCEKLYVRTNRRRQESPPFYRSLGFFETHLTFDLPLGAKAGDGQTR